MFLLQAPPNLSFLHTLATAKGKTLLKIHLACSGHGKRVAALLFAVENKNGPRALLQELDSIGQSEISVPGLPRILCS